MLIAAFYNPPPPPPTSTEIDALLYPTQNPWADPGGMGGGGPGKIPFRRLCYMYRLFNIGPKIGPNISYIDLRCPPFKNPRSAPAIHHSYRVVLSRINQQFEMKRLQ